MPTTTASRTRRDATNEMDWARGLGLEATRDAQEALVRSLRATVDTLTTFSEVGQRVGRELVSLTMEGTKETLRLWAEVSGSTLDAFQAGAGAWVSGRPALETWQRMLDGSARAFGRFAEGVQGTAEHGTERIKEAVDTVAGQMKENSAALGELGDLLEDRGSARSSAGGARTAAAKN